MKHSTPISVKILVVFACSYLSVHYAAGQLKYPQPYLQNNNEGLLYDVSFQYKSHYISGLLAIKKEIQGYHFVLITKTGPTIMDFIITDKGIDWDKKIEALDRPIFLKAMEKDFRTIVLSSLDKPKKIKRLRSNLYKVRKVIRHKVATDHLERVLSAKSKGLINPFKIFATYLYKGEDNIPDQILVRHRLIKSKLDLKLIKQ